VSVVQIVLPRHTGEYRIRAELSADGSPEILACSEKIAHVFSPHSHGDGPAGSKALVHEDGEEIALFLGANNVIAGSVSFDDLGPAKVVIVKEGLINGETYRGALEEVSRFVREGGSLLLIEPEKGITRKEVIPVLDGLSLTIEPRTDTDKGGYDSYVFAEDLNHPLWEGIDKKHLQMFNGGFGGEVVSQHYVICHADHRVLARCGLSLSVEAVFEIPFGEGKVIVSRLQLRGRLRRSNSRDSLFSRRPDPVLQQYFLNLVHYALKSGRLVGALKAKDH
jgi:hypothetical protein